MPFVVYRLVFIVVHVMLQIKSLRGFRNTGGLVINSNRYRYQLTNPDSPDSHRDRD